MGKSKARYNEQGQKECTKCHTFRDVVQFYVSKRDWDGREPTCQFCRRQRHKEKPRLRPHVPIDQRKRMLQVSHRNNEKLCSNCKQWLALDQFSKNSQSWDMLRRDCRSCAKAKRIAKSRLQGVISREQRRTPYNEQGQKLCCKCKTWKGVSDFASDKSKWDKHSTKCKLCDAETQRRRRKADPGLSARSSKQKYHGSIQARLRQTLKNRIWWALSGKVKSAHTLELLGCLIEEFKTHLERQFQPGMTWENYGYRGWHIDHIQPCSVFDLTDPEQQRICFNYNNLQPMWGADNLKKSGPRRKIISHGNQDIPDTV